LSGHRVVSSEWVLPCGISLRPPRSRQWRPSVGVLTRLRDTRVPHSARPHCEPPHIGIEICFGHTSVLEARRVAACAREGAWRYAAPQSAQWTCRDGSRRYCSSWRSSVASRGQPDLVSRGMLPMRRTTAGRCTTGAVTAPVVACRGVGGAQTSPAGPEFVTSADQRREQDRERMERVRSTVIDRLKPGRNHREDQLCRAHRASARKRLPSGGLCTTGAPRAALHSNSDSDTDTRNAPSRPAAPGAAGTRSRVVGAL